jgi:hypothetical protein
MLILIAVWRVVSPCIMTQWAREQDYDSGFLFIGSWAWVSDRTGSRSKQSIFLSVYAFGVKYRATVCWLIDWLIDWLIEHLYSAQIHSVECSWPFFLMFWSVLKTCHILKLLSAAKLTHHSHFPTFENFGACWFLYISTILGLTHRDCRIFIVRAWCFECVHILDLGLSFYPKDVRVTSPRELGTAFKLKCSILLWC